MAIRAQRKAIISTLACGDVGDVPKGDGHALRDTSAKSNDTLVVFIDGDDQSIDLDGWIATNPDRVLGNTFQRPPDIMERLARRSSSFSDT